MVKYFFFFLICLFFGMACQSSKPTSTKADILPELVGKWQVTAFRFKDGRVMPGELMGYPQYEFTQDGYRIKTLNTEPAPPPDTVPYKVLGDSIRYPKHPKYPRMKIERLEKDTLVLSNDKLSWYLHQ